jgi:peptide/nickel transport system permease protein
MWVEVARVVRGQVISVKEMQYVTAARALGFDFELFSIIFYLTLWRR